MLKPLEQIPMAFLRQVSSVSPGDVDFAFESERQPGRLKCGCRAVFAQSLDGKFLLVTDCVLSPLAPCWVSEAHFLVFPLTTTTQDMRFLF